MVVLEQKVLSLVVVFGFAAAQEKFEGRYHSQVGNYENHLTEIPKGFSVKGSNAVNEFQKYASAIQSLAAQENMNVIFKVKVETIKNYNSKATKSISIKNKKSKKFNVPLKKASMKLSNFELILRRLAEENDKLTSTGRKFQATTKRINKGHLTTKQWSAVGKYKPIIGRIKTNFTKIIRPVKPREIVLTK